MSSTLILSVRDLTIGVKNSQRKIVEDVSFTLKRGEIVCLFGPSGAGKSLLTQAILGLLPEGITLEGEIYFDDVELRKNPNLLSRIRGKDIAYIPQDPHSSLNPVIKVGPWIENILRFHGRRMPASDRKQRVLEVFRWLGFHLFHLRLPFFHFLLGEVSLFSLVETPLYTKILFGGRGLEAL